MSDNQQVQSDQPVTPPSFGPQEPTSTEPIEPDSTNPADSSSAPNLSAPSKDATPSPISPPDVPVDSSQIVVPEVSPSVNLGTPSDLSDISINNIPPDNQVTSAPSDSSNTTSSEIPEKPQNPPLIEPSSTPAPPESPAMPPISPADGSSSTPPSDSFGDLLSETVSDKTTPGVALVDSPGVKESVATLQSLHPTTNDQPQTNDVSFGDLIKDIKPEESVIPSPPVPPSVSSSASPQPTTNNPQPISFPSPISPLPATARVSAGISPQSPLSSQSDFDQKLKEALVLRRQKANAVRHAKKKKILDKLEELVRSKGKFTSVEAQKILDLPQSTLGDYFAQLVSRGIIKKFGKGRGMYYTM